MREPTEIWLWLSRVHFPVTSLGPGVRLGIWVQGCTLACPGCMARDTWRREAGERRPVPDLVDAWTAAREAGATGVTISGGEPTEQAGAVVALIREIREAQPPDAGEQGADVLLYTGLDEEEFAARVPELAGVPDAVVFGRFDVTRPTDLVWRGSENQVLRPLTALGRQRYAEHEQRRSTSPDVQIAVDQGRLLTIGVPRHGDLLRLERLMRQRGVELAGVSWRP